MSSLLRKRYNKIILLLGLTMLFLPEKSVYAEEVVSLIPNGIQITDTTTEQTNIIVYQDTLLPETSGFKSYMSYTAVSSTSTQGLLQKYCHTDEDGLRRFDDLYVVAIGSGANARVGDFIDIYLENNEIIHAIVGDIKQEQHTDSSNLVGKNGCCLEYFADTSELESSVKDSGDVSNLKDEWDCPVAMFRVYKFH